MLWRGAVALAGRDETDALTAELAQEFGASAVRLFATGTAALQVAMRLALGARPDAVLLLPAYACYDLVSAAIGAQARVAFYDVDPRTLQPDAASLAAAPLSDVAAIVVAHLYGIPVDVPALRARLPAHVRIIEDAAQGVGATVSGRPAGATGDWGILSFGRGKGRTGSGGGALLVNSRDARTIVVPDHPEPPDAGAAEWAKAVVQWGVGRPAVYGLPAALPGLGLGETVYHPPAPPRRMARACVAMVRAAGRAPFGEARHRQRLGAWLLTRVPPAARIDPGPAGDAGLLRLPILAPTEAMRERWLLEGAAFGVARGYPVPLPAIPAAAHWRQPVPPGAKRLAATLLTLPVHSRVTEADLASLETWMHGWHLDDSSTGGP